MFGKRNMVRVMPPNSPSYRMADRLSDGRLADILRTARDEGLSYQRIAFQLHTDLGVEVSDQTIANWCLDLGIEKAKAS